MTNAEKKALVKDMTIEDIISYCKENNQTAWLSAKMEETVTRKHYPYVKEKDPKTGKLKCKLDENGKKIVDYTKPPKLHTQPIGFMEIKRDFIVKFMPELLCAPKEKPVSMRDKLAAALEG